VSSSWLPQWPRAPFSQASAGPKNGRQVKSKSNGDDAGSERRLGNPVPIEESRRQSAQICAAWLFVAGTGESGSKWEWLGTPACLFQRCLHVTRKALARVARDIMPIHCVVALEGTPRRRLLRRDDEDVRQDDHSHASWRPYDDWCGDQRARPRSPASLWASRPSWTVSRLRP
jgi:hypothetical protein